MLDLHSLSLLLWLIRKYTTMQLLLQWQMVLIQTVVCVCVCGASWNPISLLNFVSLHIACEQKVYQLKSWKDKQHHHHHHHHPPPLQLLHSLQSNIRRQGRSTQTLGFLVCKRRRRNVVNKVIKLKLKIINGHLRRTKFMTVLHLFSSSKQEKERWHFSRQDHKRRKRRRRPRTDRWCGYE